MAMEPKKYLKMMIRNITLTFLKLEMNIWIIFFLKRVLFISLHRYDEGYFYPVNALSNFNYIGEGNGKGKTTIENILLNFLIPFN